jgi:hypothetical protein
MSLMQFQHLAQKINSNFQKLSKYRIIQKNLVHFQGFPEDLNNEKILESPEYFGQYGTIKKICLVPIKDNRTYHSAYITFETEEQAAYCILAVDSIKIKNNLVRAFFGTTKYCNNFLKGYHCLNKKCKFMHYLADNKNDIIINDIKFGYSEHINLAKKIIGFGTIKSFEYIKNNYDAKIKHILPDIRHIYSIQHINDKNKNHRRQPSTSSNNSTNSSANNSIKSCNTFNSLNNNINEFINEFLDDDNNDQTVNITCEKPLEVKKEEKIEEKKPKAFLFENKNVKKIIDGLLIRKSFFRKFEKYEFGKSLFHKFEIEFCKNFFNNNEDEIIKSIIE